MGRLALPALALWSAAAFAQVDHAAHHPPAVGAPPAMGAAPDAGAMAGMAGPAGMAGMMEAMMGPLPGPSSAKAPLYPSLMTLPSLTPEKRAEIDALAAQQLDEGMSRLAAASESLTRATQSGDHAGMQQAVTLMREGLDQLESGIAARRVSTEGRAPRSLALEWFKRELSLTTPASGAPSRALFAPTPFHFLAMVLLVLFALAMVVMYFFKMRRATALFGRLEAGPEQPPSGSAPPAAASGAPGPPPAPPAGATPRAAGGSTAPSASASAQVPSANWRGQLRVGHVVPETGSVKTIRLVPLSGDGLMPFTFVPGQFLNVTLSIGGARMIRSYSISSSPTHRDHVELTVRREPRGAVSRHITDLLEPGAVIEASGPVGRFTFDGTEAGSIVLIAGGVGITPMMSIARYLSERGWPGDVFFIYACRAPADFIFARQLAELQRLNSKLHLVVTMSRTEGTEWQGPRGHLTRELLAQTVPQLASRRIHLCGPPSMMNATRALLAELGVPAEQVKTEAFGTPRPAPAAAQTTSKPTVAATGPRVTFSRHQRSARIYAGQTLLELSEALSIAIESSCRVGTCGVCKVKLTSGDVAMAVQDGLDPQDRAGGFILACQAKPITEIAVEA